MALTPDSQGPQPGTLGFAELGSRTGLVLCLPHPHRPHRQRKRNSGDGSDFPRVAASQGDSRDWNSKPLSLRATPSFDKSTTDTCWLGQAPASTLGAARVPGRQAQSRASPPPSRARQELRGLEQKVRMEDKRSLWLGPLGSPDTAEREGAERKAIAPDTPCKYLLCPRR